MHGNDVVDTQFWPPGFAVIVNEVIEALSKAGGVNLTVAEPLPGVADRPVEGFGAPATTVRGAL